MDPITILPWAVLFIVATGGMACLRMTAIKQAIGELPVERPHASNPLRKGPRVFTTKELAEHDGKGDSQIFVALKSPTGTICVFDATKHRDEFKPNGRMAGLAGKDITQAVLLEAQSAVSSASEPLMKQRDEKSLVRKTFFEFLEHYEQVGVLEDANHPAHIGPHDD